MSFEKNASPGLQVTTSQLARIATKKILFGHQSVGDNIIKGMIKYIERDPDASLAIRMVAAADDFDTPVLGHVYVGANGDPKSKCDAFRKILENGIGDRIDVALFKFCFVDFAGDTDVENLFAYYETTMAYLKNKFPRVTFIHVTVPLTAMPSGVAIRLKSLMKRLLGREDWIYSGNVQRNRYNHLLLKRYSGKEPVFDLAAVESTWPNEHKQTFTYRGKPYFSLAPIYTDDGEHLNELGQHYAAQSFLALLSDSL